MKTMKKALCWMTVVCLLLASASCALAEGSNAKALKNGLTNGAVNGLASGLKDGAKNGLASGLKDGLKNGLINGTLK